MHINHFVSSKLQLLFCGIILLTIGCGTRDQKTKDAAGGIDTITLDKDVKRPEAQKASSIPKRYTRFGEVTGTIDFVVPDKAFEDGMQHWISLSDPQRDLSKLKDADSLVIKSYKVSLVIDYPLRKEFHVEMTSSGGFTKRKLVELISQYYAWIYETEEKSAKIKTIPPEDRKSTYNRNETDGDFGIWGHDLTDLVLSGIYIHENKNGEILLSLEVDS